MGRGLSSDTASPWATTLPDSSTQEPTGRTQKVRPSISKRDRFSGVTYDAAWYAD